MWRIILYHAGGRAISRVFHKYASILYLLVHKCVIKFRVDFSIEICIALGHFNRRSTLHVLTNFVKRSVCYEAGRRSFGYEIDRFLWNGKFIIVIQIPLLDCVLSLELHPSLNTLALSLMSLLELPPNIRLSYPNTFFPSGFLDKIFLCFRLSYLPCIL